MIEIIGTIVYETELAFVFDNGWVKDWIPRAVAQGAPPYGEFDDTEIEILVPEWLAIEKGFV